MIEHNKDYSKIWTVDSKGNMIDITNRCPITFCQNMSKILGDNMIDKSLITKSTEDIYDYIVEKVYKMPEYIQDESFKSPDKLKIAFNKLFFKIIQ
jgi:hypothetical protein|tara:strand:+ start:190 stop:477 length:288 start_codon:yes stop_codon:yes gene_type:complete